VLDAAHVMIAAVVTPAAAADGPAATPALTAEQSGSWRARCMRAHARTRTHTRFVVTGCIALRCRSRSAHRSERPPCAAVRRAAQRIASRTTALRQAPISRR
jgi:hypothetical protein